MSPLPGRSSDEARCRDRASVVQGKDLRRLTAESCGERRDGRMMRVGDVAEFELADLLARQASQSSDVYLSEAEREASHP